ncbi:inosine-uridine preferring nucleoside hydrolase-like [Actinia tenebrosa]|uniref:Inosine-uridine preferring nucleoside hydrolase-like n=1 Tax=Actinia tenebrosa TaxID=6105 RepID=A0A6P8ISL4_ACTTE|nr:inosine-uridine preferring nucleoside hydrolase-like [Actinia tenebrosa]
MAKRKFIIDCDAGVDDAFALILALNQPDVDVLAVTCVGGNTELNDVCINVMKVLEVCKRTDVPVFKGASTSLIGVTTKRASHFHGKDGLGDATGIPDPDMSRLKEEHAVNAILRLTRQHPGEITLVALAPLTNIALACRLDPMLPQNLKNVVIMGGNCEAKGNDDRVCAEFNFHTDVEAASVCLNELTCPVAIVTWETCLQHCLSWEFYDELTSLGTDKSNFFKKITKTSSEFYRQKKEGYGMFYTCCDLFAMAVAVSPDIVEEQTHVHATVELSGKHTRGQMVVDWRGSLKKQPNLMLVRRCNIEKYKVLALNSLK